MKTINGNLLEIKEGIICHQVNCKRVAGAGLALQIRKKWPRWYDAYRRYSEPELGEVFLFPVESELYLASLYGQDRYGRGLQTNYFALESALKKLRLLLSQAFVENEPVYFPRIGAGMGGGDWNVIEPLIQKYFEDAIIVEKA